MSKLVKGWVSCSTRNKEGRNCGFENGYEIYSATKENWSPGVFGSSESNGTISLNSRAQPEQI
jgi:hypothetical protein